MALPRRSYGHHRPDWEQRLCRVDAALAEGDLSPAQARDRYRTLGREQVDDLTTDDAHPDTDDADNAWPPPDDRSPRR